MLPYVRPPLWLRERLFARSQGRCEHCHESITFETMHVAHLFARAHGGPLIEENTAPWCGPCNWRNGPHNVEDKRLPAREWQLEKLDAIIERLLEQGSATVSAAPGAGKTVFAGFVFERLRELDAIDRMVVLVPRCSLVTQWVEALAHARYLELRPDSAYERHDSHQVGVVATYQSLINPEQRLNHRREIARARTLLVLDEVHHVGELAGPGRQRLAWAQYVQDLAGTVDPPNLHATAILNLSGTLWRSPEGQRISTVRYDRLPDGQLLSRVDADIPVKLLIDRQELRSVDLFQLGARVEMADYANLKVIDSHIADLAEKPARIALRHLGNNAVWRKRFVEAVIDRLIVAHKSLGGQTVKALIVAATQEQARLMCEMVDVVMTERKLQPLAELAISDEPAARQVLEAFRIAQRPGVLCTVDMAGEGYDCPEIAVVGYASHKSTPLYIRQVVARAQRVTAYERAQQQPIPAAVVIPKIPALVELMAQILIPMQHELTEDLTPPPPPPPRKEKQTPADDDGIDGTWCPPGPAIPTYTVERVEMDRDFLVSVSGQADSDVAGTLVLAVEAAFAAVQLRPADATRAIVALRNVSRDRRVAQPFDPLSPIETDLETVSASPPARPAPPEQSRSMSDEAQARMLMRKLQKAGGWWKTNTARDVASFVVEINRAGGIWKGGRPRASIAQLEQAWAYADRRIIEYCDEHQVARPVTAHWGQS